VTISTLVALGTEPQLKLHINTGFNVGLTKEKIVGALIHCIPYVGFPVCSTASRSSRKSWRSAASARKWTRSEASPRVAA
jgi:alkylhydroperoxidase/carboxymuconolactone decarboxylase family protein YurZ